jgi:hypothetical protein
MKSLAAALLAAIPLLVVAQSTERPRPPGTIPLEAPPPPPPLIEHTPTGPVPARAAPQQPLPEINDPDTQITKGAPEPQVTERVEGDTRIQEYRLNGKVYMQKVTPKHGKTYVLTDQKGDGTFTRLDQSLDQQVRVPQWVLWEF